MNASDLLEQLNIQLGDTSNVTFTAEEKQRALKKAFRDPYVVKTVWDSTLLFDTTDYQQALPSGVDTIKDIYLSASNSTSDAPEPIESSLWEVVNGNLQWSPRAKNFINDGDTLYIKGHSKYDYDTDTITEYNLQEYVLALAGYETLGILSYKKANLFIKNDTTMSELIGLRREFKRDIQEYRQRLPKEYEGA